MLLRVDDTIGLFYLFLTPIVMGPFIASWLSPHIYDDTVHGYAASGFEQVYEAFRSHTGKINSSIPIFRRNFGEGLERDGAAVVVYHKGVPVVDLRNFGEGLERDGAAVVVYHKGVPVVDLWGEFWPEYGAFGKENTTVEDVLSHKAGLPYLNDHIDFHDVIDFTRVKRKIELSRPVWEPGENS
ncbi:unnamed protein product [Nippostrongylus brasiliensis]|uniref:Beta-lactamase domain-containing protein n=1 Tax=Nippostrongylus brasiliensis TaxID=27835 RepID=A0A0N4YSK9_NIPBR|nr:unnamed protein product [Nippostrongylus brasiliensis]